MVKKNAGLSYPISRKSKNWTSSLDLIDWSRTLYSVLDFELFEGGLRLSEKLHFMGIQELVFFLNVEELRLAPTLAQSKAEPSFL